MKKNIEKVALSQKHQTEDISSKLVELGKHLKNVATNNTDQSDDLEILEQQMTAMLNDVGVNTKQLDLVEIAPHSCVELTEEEELAIKT